MRLQPASIRNAFAALFLLTSVGMSHAATFKVLHSFADYDGVAPFDSLALDKKGNLYGTTYFGGLGPSHLGGPPRNGAAFRIKPTGKFTVLHSFVRGAGGSFPQSNLLVDKKTGNLYGTTVAGGGRDAGTVFMLAADGTETVLYSFQGYSDGAVPQAGVIADKDHNLYGTTTWHAGTVFKLAPDGILTSLHTFGGSDGSFPTGNLVADKAGNLYGTTQDGGTAGCGGSGCGVVFEITSSGTFKVLHAFTGATDGAWPYAGLIINKNGNLFGTATSGGSYGQGTVFELSADGKETTLYSFKGGSDGSKPRAGVVSDKDGNLFGTTEAGGSDGCDGKGCGTVYELSPQGAAQVLYSFTGGDDGSEPFGGVILDKEGNLYGTTNVGGKMGYGTVFAIMK